MLPVAGLCLKCGWDIHLWLTAQVLFVEVYIFVGDNCFCLLQSNCAYLHI